MAVTTSQASVTSSLGSRTYDSPRKRREFPRRPKPSIPKQISQSTSQASSAKRSQTSSARRSHTSSIQLSQKSSAKRSQASSTRTPPSHRQKPGIKPTHNLYIKPTASPRPSPRSSPKTLPPIQKSIPPSSPRASPKTVPGKPPIMAPLSGTSKSTPKLPSKPSKATQQVLRPAGTRSFSKSSTASVEQKRCSPGRTIFHVRLSLGYMSGIKVEQLAKRKKRDNHNLLVVGYAALAKTGKQIALSQPLLPSLGGSKPKSLKLCWANPRSMGEAGSNSKAKRRLHFSLQLESESDRASTADDDSIGTEASYNPEVVKVVIGLKCGDEKFPLGVANLVVNGKQCFDKKIDLAVRPVNEPSTLGQKSRLGIFGIGKKQGRSFSNDDHVYTIASNATLRVKVDIKEGSPGQSKAAIWGEGDDASFATKWSYDTRGTMASLSRSIALPPSQPQVGTSRQFQEEMPPPASQPGNNYPMMMSPSSGWVEVIPDMDGKNIITSQKPKKRIQSTGPLKYVVVRPSNDARSMTSGLTAPHTGFGGSFFFKSCFPISLCGDESASLVGDRGQIDAGFSFNSGLNDDDEPSSDDDEISSDPPEMVSSRSDASTSDVEDLPGSTSEEFQKDEKQSGNGSASQENQLPNLDAESIPKDGAADHETGSIADETVDITVDTYIDLKDAQATLLRYASKVGIQMEDLLDGMENDNKSGKLKKTFQSIASASIK